jgi:hypothetical protein
METILAVDFMLANFAGAIWKKLREDGAYLRVVHDAMQRLWKPHYDQIATRGPHARQLFPFWDR